MSIATKTGDGGTTGLMFNRRVSKCHPRVEACGAVDELNAALGLARATAAEATTRELLLQIQRQLIALMGELATLPEDAARYRAEGYPEFDPAHIAFLDQQVARMEARQLTFHGWAMPGENLPASALELARTTCRRAERRVCALHDAGQLAKPEMLVYLNRLSDVLWLLAREAEHSPALPRAHPS